MADETLRIGVQNERPPFSFRDADGKLQGFDVEIAWALCGDLKAQCDLSPLEFAALIPALQQGRIDAAVASISITEERLQLVDFTDKYYQSGNRFVARRGAFASFTLADLAGKTIGVKRGTTHDRYLSNTLKDRLDNPTIQQLRRDLHRPGIGTPRSGAGRRDLADRASSRPTSGAISISSARSSTDPAWFGRGEGIAVRKGNAELVARLNQALREILADGTYAEIRTQYFDYDIYGSPRSTTPALGAPPDPSGLPRLGSSSP